MTGSGKRRAQNDPAPDDGAEEPSPASRARRPAGKGKGSSPSASGRGTMPRSQPPPPPAQTAAPPARALSQARAPALPSHPPPPPAAAPEDGDASHRSVDLEDENEEQVDLDTSLDEAGLSRRKASRIKASVDERPAGYTLNPLKVTILIFSVLISSLIHVCLQASLYTVPYAIAGTGRNFSGTDAASIILVTKMLRAGLSRHADDRGTDISEINRHITTFPKNFGIHCSSFASNLLTKAIKNRVHASQMLLTLLSVPRHSIQIAPNEREHVDAVHEMLQLADQQALLDIAHPLSVEHGATVERIRFFPAGGKDAEQTFRCTGKETVAGQFLQALGASPCDQHTLLSEIRFIC